MYYYKLYVNICICMYYFILYVNIYIYVCMYYYILYVKNYIYIYVIPRCSPPSSSHGRRVPHYGHGVPEPHNGAISGVITG